MFLFIFVCSFSFQNVHAGKIILSTKAQVKSHVVTTREQDIHHLIREELGDEVQGFGIDESDEQVIREWLLYYEASTFYNTSVGQKKVDQLFQKISGPLNKNKKWKFLSVTKKQLRQKIKRYLEAVRLYEFKKKSSILPVSAGEIETEYSQNRVRYGNFTFDQVKDQIRKNKAQANLKVRMNQWFAVLEKKYKVQRFSLSPKGMSQSK